MEPFSIRFPDELMEQVKTESERLKLTPSELVRKAVEFDFKGNPRQQNMQTIMERMDRLEYEVVCLRAMLGRLYSTEDYTLVKKFAHEEATTYLERLKNGMKG